MKDPSSHGARLMLHRVAPGLWAAHLSPAGAVAFTLLLMEMLPSELLRSARMTAGLSRRALAVKADVPTTTVTRIETGRSDPSFGTLARLLDAAGADLIITARLREEGPTVASLATAIDTVAGRLRIDWTRLRAFADWACQHPGGVPAAISDPPARTGTALDAILAGFAEQLAALAGVPAPPWARSVPNPVEPWEPPGTPAMLERARAATPEEFQRRNITLPRSALFRSAA